MKKIVILILITAIVAFGCTRIPDSVETGVKPGEYEGLKNTDELKEKNDSLSKDVETTKEQLDKMKEDYLSLAKSNDETLKKLHEAEELLKVLQDSGIPKFSSENTDRNKILEYLHEKKSLMDKNFRGLEILPIPSNDKIILFETKGYGSYYNQLFAWEPGNKEPVMIEGAHYNIGGGWEWLISGKYLMISVSDEPDCDKMVVDIAGKKVSNTFKTSSDDIYLIPETSSILMQKSVNETSAFVLYDFLSGQEKEMKFDFPNKNLKFKVNDENKEIIFTGTYKDDYADYSVQAAVTIAKIKEKYEIKALELQSNEANKTDEQGKTEENEEGTI